ncbi:MAG: acyl-CoA dehydratase activase [Polyangia bacterium]|jgi:predicted CoA-substrate-specific enzyme activase|nr:acyl-CoA dehydratase activase [Polyangia bacterium]
MPNPSRVLVAGVDVGSECVKAVVLGEDRSILGRSLILAAGYFGQRAREALESALDDAQQPSEALAAVGVTGFGARNAELPKARTLIDSSCHARGAFHYFPEPLTVVDIGGRSPSVIQVDAEGLRLGTRGPRKCAVGIGTFLEFAARHLDVHPTRLMELASAADRPVPISSYCSVYGESEILEALRAGATREQIALGCMHSVAERILELGPLTPPVAISGGVMEYFPGVAAALEHKCGLPVRVVPEPIQTAALGAALLVLDQPAATASVG